MRVLQLCDGKQLGILSIILLCLVLFRYFDISSDFQMDSFVQKLVLNAIEYTIYRREWGGMLNSFFIPI